MIGGEDQIVIAVPAEAVFDTVADQRNEPAYNPAMLDSQKLTDGPIGEGTRFRAVVASRGRPMGMVIEYTAFDRPHRIESTTRMTAADIAYVLTFRPHPAGTLMRWSWRLSPHGWLRLLGPVIARAGRRQERRVWTNLKRHLEKQAATPPPSATAKR